MQLARVRHIAFTVRDLEQSVPWYRDLFELDEIRREVSEERSAAILGSPSSRLQIGLVQHSRTDQHRFDPTTVGLDHAAWSVESRDELDAWARELESKGVEHSPVVDLGPIAILNFKDPDGIALSLFWDAPNA